jgi:hypothetical protein
MRAEHPRSLNFPPDFADNGRLLPVNDGRRHGRVDRREAEAHPADSPWAIVRFFGRITRGVLASAGAIVVLIVLGYVYSEEIVEYADSHYGSDIDERLDIDRSSIARLHERAYFAQESTLVTEDLKTVACISSPEHRILIDEVEEIPPLFVKAILASEDKNFFKHEGVDKAAIIRAFVKHLLSESRSGASTLTMQIAKHLRGGTGRASTEKEKIGDMVMALRIEREFTRQDLLVKYVNMPYFGRGQYGIEAASRAYFGKPAKELELPQVAFIVALINKPALPDRTFATDPALKSQELVRDANWGEQVRGTIRVLDLMLDQNEITDVDYERAANAVQTSVAQGSSPTQRRLRHERPLPGTGAHSLQGPLPINKGGLTISITRDDALQDVLAKAVAMTVSTYLARHQDDTGQQPASRRSVRGRVHRRRARRGRQRRFQEPEVRRDRDGVATAGVDVQDLHVRRDGRETHENDRRRRAHGDPRSHRRQSPRALYGARRADLRLTRPRTRVEGNCELLLALGAAVSRRDQLQDRARRVAQHGGDARGRAGRNQERDRSRLSHRTAEGHEARAAAVSDDGDRRHRK